jgi:hypothetical protein
MWGVALAETETGRSGAPVPEIMSERRSARSLTSDVSVLRVLTLCYPAGKIVRFITLGTGLAPRCDGKYNGRSHRKKSVKPAVMVLRQNPGLLTVDQLPTCSLLFCANGNACCSPVLSALSSRMLFSVKAS